jgi:DNA-binding transcriptional LysR family regulator
VTRYIRELETRLDVFLLDRTSRGVTPTSAGELLVRHARSISAEIRVAEEELKRLRDFDVGSVRIGMNLGVAYLVTEAMQRVLDTSPNISMNVVEGIQRELLPHLRDGEIDVVVSPLHELGGPGPELVEEVLTYNRTHVIARWDHPLAGRRKIPAQALLDYEWILPPRMSPVRAQIENAFDQVKVSPPRAGIETASSTIMRELLRSSDRLAVIGRSAIHGDYEVKLLRPLDTALTMPIRPVGFVVRAKQEASPPVARFIEVLREVGRSGQFAASER